MEKEILEGSEIIARFMGVFMEVTNKPNEWGKNSTLLEVTPIYELPFIFIPTETRHISQTDDFNKIRESALEVSWGRVCQKAKYHTSWDWIVPVCEKITAMNLKSDSDGLLIMSKIFNYASLFELQKLWLAVVEFIEWYNTQSKVNK